MTIKIASTRCKCELQYWFTVHTAANDNDQAAKHFPTARPPTPESPQVTDSSTYAMLPFFRYGGHHKSCGNRTLNPFHCAPYKHYQIFNKI